jgi:hypothetical protein
MITYYKDNSELSEKVVDTVNGQREYRINCAKIKHKYYIKGVDCFFINKKWYTIDCGLITFDHEIKQWVMKKSNMMNGIVGFENEVPIFGDFSPNPYNNVCCKYVETVIRRELIPYSFLRIPDDMSDEDYSRLTGTSLGVLKRDRMLAAKEEYREYTERVEKEALCINEEILIENGFVENKQIGFWIHPKDIISSLVRSKLNVPRNVQDPRNKGYNIEDNKEEYPLKCQLYELYNTPITKKARKFARYLGDITWGSEIECIVGYLPTYIQNRYGIIVCRDGSLKAVDSTQGSEYTTIPVSGVKGLVSLHYTCKEISKRNLIDEHCAFHIHIGNLPTTRTFIVALYKLGLSIQDELFSMFAYYKNDEPKYAGKEKNYCNKLLDLAIDDCCPSNHDEYVKYINWSYKKIFAFLSEKSVPDRNFNRKNKKHPTQYKWERHSRYYWLNLMNILFSDRNTAEFRLHTGTMNSQKAINWLFICNAIVKTAISCSKDILRGKKFTLSEVLSYYPNTFNTEHSRFLYNYLMGYINQRKSWMEKDLKKNDYMSRWEIQEDADYEYTYDGVKDLV